MDSKIAQRCLYSLNLGLLGLFLPRLSIILSASLVSILVLPSIGFCQDNYLYLPSFELNEARSHLSESIPAELFSNPKDKLMIEDGKIYHGTSIDSAESILRTRKIVIQSFGNSTIHTANVRGRGWYFTGRYSDAIAYALMKENNGGTLIPAKIRPGSKILIWNRAIWHPYIQSLLAEFGESDRAHSPQKTLDFLATQGVDIVVNGATEIIVINRAAIELSDSIYDLSKQLEDQIKKSESDFQKKRLEKLLYNLQSRGFGSGNKPAIRCSKIFSDR